MLKVVVSSVALLLLLAMTVAMWSIADSSLRTAHAEEHAAYCARVDNAILLSYSDPREVYPGPPQHSHSSTNKQEEERSRSEPLRQPSQFICEVRESPFGTHMYTPSWARWTSASAASRRRHPLRRHAGTTKPLLLSSRASHIACFVRNLNRIGFRND